MFKKYILLATLLMSSGLSFGAAEPAPDEICFARCGLTVTERDKLAFDSLTRKEFPVARHRFDAMSREQLNSFFEEGSETLLHCAVEDGCLASVQYFIDRGVDLNAYNEHNETPLRAAMERALRETVLALINAPGIDLNKVAGNGDRRMTPLCFALFIADESVALALIKAGADVTIAHETNGNTPLHYTIKSGLSITGNSFDLGMSPKYAAEIAAELLEKGARSDVENAKGETPLALVQQKDKEFAYLIRYNLKHLKGGLTGLGSSSGATASNHEHIQKMSQQCEEKLNFIPRKLRYALRAAWIAAALGSGYKLTTAFKQIKKSIIAQNTAAAENDETVKLITDNAELNKLARQALWKKHKKLLAVFAGSVTGGLADLGIFLMA